TRELDGEPTQRQRCPSVREDEPAGVGESVAQIAPGEWVAVDPLAVVRQQIARGVLGTWCEPVVGAGHERARSAEQRRQRLDCDGYATSPAQVVASVDHQVGLELGESTHPGHL